MNFYFSMEVIYNQVLNSHMFKLFKELFLSIYIFWRGGEGGLLFSLLFKELWKRGVDIFRHYSSLLKLPIFDVPVLWSLVVPVVPLGVRWFRSSWQRSFLVWDFYIDLFNEKQIFYLLSSFQWKFFFNFLKKCWRGG